MLKLLAASLILLLTLLLCACNVKVKHNEQEGDKKLDITTPVGGIHVSKEANPRATGLDVYPGSKLIEKDSQGEDKSANVSISTGFFGLKVVAQEYESDAAPDRLINYYAGQLKNYGKVLECHTSWKGSRVSLSPSRDKSKELTCDENSGEAVELKVGTEDNQHIVSIAPQGRGSKYELVLIQIRGKQDTI